MSRRRISNSSEVKAIWLTVGWADGFKLVWEAGDVRGEGRNGSGGGMNPGEVKTRKGTGCGERCGAWRASKKSLEWGNGGVLRVLLVLECPHPLVLDHSGTHIWARSQMLGPRWKGAAMGVGNVGVRCRVVGRGSEQGEKSKDGHKEVVCARGKYVLGQGWRRE